MGDKLATALRIARATGGSVERHPTDAQKEAGNYRKEHLAFHGLQIAIENKKGATRSGVGPTGRRWSCVLPADYGYIKGTEGADGDHVDCYVGPHRDSHIVFVVDQKDPRTGKFDEHKCLLGFRNEDEARKIYDAGFSDNSGPRRRGHMTTMSLGAFKNWLRAGHTKKPLGEQREARAEGGSVTEKVHTGPIHSAVAGRTDHLPMHVPSGSYVIPADIVSSFGEGNTIAGFKAMRRMFGGVPYRNKPMPYGQGETPYNEPLPRAAGGETGHVPIVAAGGEYVLTPEQVRLVGDGDLDTGHRVLDEFIKRSRKDLINTLRKLPGPKKS